jgi:TPR repeat protein
MPTFNRITSFGWLASVLLLCAGGSASFAFDGTETGTVELQPIAPSLPVPGAIQRGRPHRFSNVGDALQQGWHDLQAGEKQKAADALEYAAGEGNVAAQWKLGRMYADGDGVDHDDYRAFQYFSKMADMHADISPESMFAPAVAKAFVALGTYYLSGIPNTPIVANPARARELFYYAAAYFADSDGQYYLGRLYLDGTPEPKDPRRAAQWLNLSAEKGHIYAMAVLGNMLVQGAEGIQKQVPKGLMWLEMAKLKADPKRDVWVLNMYDLAQTRASDEQKALAERFKRQQLAVKH